MDNDFRVALSSIGKSNYGEVEYFDQEIGNHRTRFFPVAVAHLFKPKKLFLAVTSEVIESSNFSQILEEMKNKGLYDILETIEIPSGKNKEELWEIFNIVSERIPEKSSVIFDITHAFRSLPFVFLGVVNYLRLTKEVRLERIIYGAFEAKEERQGGIPRVPIFDLTMLVELQDWQQAVSAFMLRGEGQQLAELIKKAHDRPWRSGVRDDLPLNLQNVADGIKEFSDSVRLLRPRNALSAAKKVRELLQNVKDEASRWAKPFSEILSKIDEELSPLAVEQPNTLTRENLERQLALIDYYLRKDLVVQAVLLAREWMVNWLAWRVEEPDWLRQKVRTEVLEAALNEIAFNRAMIGEREKELEELPNKEEILRQFNSLPKAKDEVAKLWDRLRNLRNDVAHCTFRDNAAPPERIRRNAEEVKQGLENLLEQEGV